MYLELKKVSTHNLKGFDVKIPLNKLVVVTGPSGSGKSSLVFDTLATLAEARFKQLKDIGQPLTPLTQTKGLLSGVVPPVISLSQGVRDWFLYKNVSEILGLFSIISFLFYEKGKIKCPQCGSLNFFHTLRDLIFWYNSLPENTKFYFLLPLPESTPQALSYLISLGYTRFFINEREFDLSEEEPPGSVKSLYLLLDRMVKEEKGLSRFLENIRVAQNINRGTIILKLFEGESFFFNLSHFCFQCGTFLLKEISRCKLCRGLGYKERKPCERCQGLKLEAHYLESELFSTTLRKIYSFTLKEFKLFFEKNLSSLERETFQNVFVLLEKAAYFEIDNLKLSTPVFELSLGERKLLEILTLFSFDLRGVLYLLDEPTLGLDEKKRKKLLTLIRELMAMGNSFIVVEHDLEFIREADFVIELGPGGGEKGGYLLYALPKKEYLKNKNTLIYPYLTRDPSFEKRPISKKEYIEITLKGKPIKILKEGINLFYGETGKGVTKNLRKLTELLKSQGYNLYEGEEFFSLRGEQFLIEYLGIWEALREILVNLPEAKTKGLLKRHFSFHTPEGQCSSCKGKGYKRTEIENYVFKNLCEECFGKGLNYEVLNLTYKGYKLFELLDFSVEEAFSLFSNVYTIKEILYTLIELNLSYLRLAQRFSELSGGEKLRVELARRLKKREKIDFLVLYFPFQGLSIRDLEDLSKFLRKLNLKGITIIMRETHPLASKISDQIIENIE
ncbi:MAG: hypothetical protein ACP5IN_03110 [Caldimicrobium sp.]